MHLCINNFMMDLEIPEYGTVLNMLGNLKQYITFMFSHDTCFELSAKRGPGDIPKRYIKYPGAFQGELSIAKFGDKLQAESTLQATEYSSLIYSADISRGFMMCLGTLVTN